MGRLFALSLILVWLSLVSSCQSDAFVIMANAPDGVSQGDDVDTEESLSKLECQQRKAKAAETRTALALIGDAAMGGLDDVGVCELAPSGSIGPTPPLSIDCTKGPDRTCIAVDPPSQPEHPWEYSSDLWQVGAWKYIGYRRYDDHHYRYSLEWQLVEGEYQPSCIVKVTATGDLDGDGIESHFERSPGVNPWSAINELE